MYGDRAPVSAMVLSGGGAYGAYEVGVMSALFDGNTLVNGQRPLNIGLFAGTSVGSFNAAAMVSFGRSGLSESSRRLRQVWLEEIARQPSGCDNGVFRIRGADALGLHCLLRPQFLAHVMQDARFVLPQVIPRSRRFSKSSLPFSANSFWKALLEQFDLSVLFELEPFQSLVRQTVSLDELRNSILGLKIIATNFDTGKAAIFTADDVAGPVGHAGILASAAIPGFFGQVEINGEFYVDGGVVMNTPLLPAVHGADVLYAVYMDPDVTKIPIENLRSTLGVFDRLLVTNFAFGLNQEIQMIEDFNRSLVLVDELDGRTEMGFQPLARTASVLKSQLGRIDGFRSTTIHRFHPADDLGGPLGFLDFSFEHIDQLIQRGYRDAVEHDCTASGCVLPQ